MRGTAPAARAGRSTLPLPMDWKLLLEWLRDHDYHLMTLGGADITLSSAIKLVVLLVVLVWLSSRVRSWTINRALSRTHLDAGTRQAVGSIVRYAVLVVGMVLILQNAGLNLSAFGVLAGALGVGVGFGL